MPNPNEDLSPATRKTFEAALRLFLGGKLGSSGETESNISNYLSEPRLYRDNHLFWHSVAEIEGVAWRRSLSRQDSKMQDCTLDIQHWTHGFDIPFFSSYQEWFEFLGIRTWEFINGNVFIPKYFVCASTTYTSKNRATLGRCVGNHPKFKRQLGSLSFMDKSNCVVWPVMIIKNQKIIETKSRFGFGGQIQVMLISQWFNNSR